MSLAQLPALLNVLLVAPVCLLCLRLGSTPVSISVFCSVVASFRSQPPRRGPAASSVCAAITRAGDGALRAAAITRAGDGALRAAATAHAGTAPTGPLS